jgi:hypothetical protein
VRAKYRGMTHAKRIAIVCASVALLALLLAASALPVFAASKQASETTRGETTNDSTVSPNITNETSTTSDGDTLTNAIVSPSPIKHVPITLTEDSSNACCGSVDLVNDQLPSGFNVMSIKSRKFSCTGKGTDAVHCTRRHIGQSITFKQATIKIVAKAPSTGNYTNEANDSYNNNPATRFEVQ